MKDAILLELADRWDKEAQTEQALDGSKEAEMPNALVRGARAEKRACADTLRTLVEMIGEI